MEATVEVSTPSYRTARVTQISGMFDYQPDVGQITRTWAHTLPIEDKTWNVGLIVGPSGSGKTRLAEHLWPDQITQRHDWSPDRALVDDFPTDCSISQITETLNAVGLGTVPAWVRPYATLSNGEQFRADMARTLIQCADLAVVDEFTSVVDRQVARIASHAVQKTVRNSDGKFVAVTCHYDIEDWLQPDWMYDVAAGVFTWRQVQPHPPLTLEIHPAARSIWPLFAPHHYMNGSLSTSAQCFAAYANNQPVAFTSYLHFPHAKTRNIKMGHRLVVLPDWQGIGIASRLEIWLGDRLFGQGYRYRNVVANPGMIRLYSRSPRWQRTGAKLKRVSSGPNALNHKANTNARRLAVQSFEYRPEAK